MKKYLFFFALCSFCFLLKADPLLIKGADGEYLPVLAEGWIEKDGGVLLNVNDKVDLALLKEALIKRFPGMGIEVIGRNVFFSAVTKQTLFPILAGFDTGISSRRDPFAALYDAKKDEILLESTRKTARSDGKGLIEATVNILEMDGIAGYATVEILINKNRSTGTYRRLRGRRRLKVYFIKRGMS